MSQGPLPYWTGVPGGEPAGTGSAYERKMKWCRGFDGVGFSAYSKPNIESIKAGRTHVWRTANALHRRSNDRAFRRFEKRAEVGVGVAAEVAAAVEPPAPLDGCAS